MAWIPPRSAKSRNSIGVLERTNSDCRRSKRALAFQWLDRPYEQRDQGFIAFVGERLFKNIEGDPRYEAFLKKMNLPE